MNNLKTYTIVRRNKRTLGVWWLTFDYDGDFLAYDAVWHMTDNDAIKFGTKKIAEDFLNAHLKNRTYAEEYTYMVLEKDEGLVDYLEIDKSA